MILIGNQIRIEWMQKMIQIIALTLFDFVARFSKDFEKEN